MWYLQALGIVAPVGLFALLLTFPLWLTVNWLGHPDNGVILVSYLGSWLMAGSCIAIGACGIIGR